MPSDVEQRVEKDVVFNPACRSFGFPEAMCSRSYSKRLSWSKCYNQICLVVSMVN